MPPFSPLVLPRHVRTCKLKVTENDNAVCYSLIPYAFLARDTICPTPILAPAPCHHLPPLMFLGRPEPHLCWAVSDDQHGADNCRLSGAKEGRARLPHRVAADATLGSRICLPARRINEKDAGTTFLAHIAQYCALAVTSDMAHKRTAYTRMRVRGARRHNSRHNCSTLAPPSHRALRRWWQLNGSSV